MTEQEKTRKYLIEELRRTREQIWELETREIDLTQSLGQEYAGLPESTSFVFYASKERGFAWQPGAFFFPIDRNVMPIPDGSVDEPDPDFSFLKDFVHSEDFPALESDLKALWKGQKDTISLRFRFHFLGEPLTWVECHLVCIKRDDRQILSEGIAWARPLGKPFGTGPHSNQIFINVVDLFQSLEEEDIPLRDLFASRWKEGAITREEVRDDLLSLASAVVRAGTLSLQAPWDLTFVKDHTMKYVWASKPFTRLLGRSVRELQGRSDSDLYATVDEAEEIRIGQAVINLGAEAHLPRTRVASGTREAFQDTLWRFSPGGKSGTGWIVGVSRLVDETKGETDQKFRSPIMVEVLKEAREAARSDSTVLLIGGSGSGKDYLARWIHEHSSRVGTPYFSVNCAAVAKELAESELFGHEAGAFTGASSRKRGLLELAEAGTLLLNEIGELSQELQAKLLTFLDTRTFTRLGGEKTVKVNARLIAATNRNLDEAVSEGNFREDFFYRLNVLRIKIPPLREWIEDIEVLSKILLEELATENNYSEAPELSADALQELRSYHWPGNVRELRNALERALLLSKGGPITRSHLPPSILGKPGDGTQAPLGQSGESEPQPIPEDMDSISRARDRFDRLSEGEQRIHIRNLFVDVCGRRAGAVTYIAELLGTTDETVRKELKAANAGEGEKKRPRKKAREEMIPKIKEYLIQNL